MIQWFIKGRRAQNVDDYETWNEGRVTPTLNVMDNTGDTRATVLIIDGTRVGDVRVIEDEIVPTVISRYGTGGGNVPMVFPIQDGREIEKSQNGLGVGEAGAPAYTVDTHATQAVAFQFNGDRGNPGVSVSEDLAFTIPANPMSDRGQAVAIQGNMIGRSDTADPQGKGYTEEGDPMFTLTKTDVHAVMPTLSVSNNPSRSPQSSEVTARVDAVVNATAVVRRLTPTECERLQGFPDSWTKWGADGKEQADSHRYKQMGNAVAVSCVSQIIESLVKHAQNSS